MEEGVELSNCDKLYFSVIARFTVILTITSLIAAIFVLINIMSYYRAAYDEVGTTLVASVVAQVRSDVSKFFVPKFNIRSVFQFAINTKQINTQDVWTLAPGGALSIGMGQYADVMGPLFYSDKDFLAAYQANDNRQVLKYAGEIPDEWFTEHRHYVNASYQERLRCWVTRESNDNPRDCTMKSPSIKSYDPFAQGWYEAADVLDGKCAAEACDNSKTFAWEGPGFQSALAEGDTDKPVFNMMFKLDWPVGTVGGATGTKHWSNFKVKFLIDQLQNVVDAVVVGKNGDLAIANQDGQILAAQSLSDGSIQELVDGEKAFKKIWSLPAFNMVTENDLGLTEKHYIMDARDKFVVAYPLREVPGWTLLLYVEVDDFLPVSSQKVSVAGALSILSIVLTAVRTILLFMTWGGQWYFTRRAHKHQQQQVSPLGLKSDLEKGNDAELGGIVPGQGPQPVAHTQVEVFPVSNH